MNPVVMHYLVEGHLADLRRSAGCRAVHPGRARSVNRRHRMFVLRWGSAADAVQGC